MPRSVVGQEARFAEAVDDALGLVAATEGLWLTAPPTSAVRQQLHVEQLEALYEAIFLRIFGHWEGYLEELTIRWMARYRSASYVPAAAAGASLHPSLGQALAALYIEDGRQRDYLLWHSGPTVKRRVARVLDQCPIETLCDTEPDALEQIAAIRHHIAHGSRDSMAKFRKAAIELTGSDHNGRPGRLLRAADLADPLNQPKWIRNICERLKDFAYTLAN
jgi:hypothetical protein